MKLNSIDKKHFWLKQEPVSGSYYVQCFRTGKGSLCKVIKGATSKTQALALGEKIYNDFIGSDIHINKRIKFKEAVKSVVVYSKKRELRESTIEKARRDFRIHLVPFFGEMFLDQITDETWIDFVNHKRELRGDDVCLTEDLKQLTKMMVWALDKGYIKKKVNFKEMAPRPRVGTVVSEAEYQKLLNAATQKFRLIIRLGYECGMRVNEIKTLTFDRLDPKEKTIYLPASLVKTNKPRIFPIPSDLFNALIGLRLNDQDCGYVFKSRADQTRPMVSHGKNWARTKARAKVRSKIRFHDLRHSALTRWVVKEGRPVAIVSRYAGVSVHTLMRVYVHTNADDLRSLVK